MYQTKTYQSGQQSKMVGW